VVAVVSRRVHDPAINAVEAASNGRQVVVERGGRACGTEPALRIRRVEQRRQLARESGSVARRHQASASGRVNERLVSFDAAGDDRLAAGHRFEQDDPEALAA